MSRLVKARQYHDKIEEAGAVLDMERLLVSSAQQLQCCIDKLDDCGSVVEWQTGEPKEDGKYLITVKGKKIVYVTADFWDNREEWDTFVAESVISWCKLSNIKPY